MNKMNEGKFYNPKINNDAKSITFANEADRKKAEAQFRQAGILMKGGGKKTTKFMRDVDFRKAKKLVKENLGESKMKIKKSELREMIAEVLEEEKTNYQEFFKRTAAKFGIDPNQLDEVPEDKKKKFFAYIEANWTGETTDETLEPISMAAGQPNYNPTKRLKAQKRDQILAKEQKAEEYVRKLVREELRFVMFNEKGANFTKPAKRKIRMAGSTDKMV